MRRMVHKYLRLSINSIKTGIEFEKDFMIYSFLGIFTAYIFSYIWKASEYFGILFFFENLLISSLLIADIDIDIRSGKLISKILKPISIDFQYFFEYWLGKITRILLLPIFVLLFNLDFIGIMRVFLFFPILQLLQFYYLFFLGSFSFKTQSSYSIYSMISLITKAFLGGLIIPMDLLREVLGNWIYYTPFALLGGRIYDIYLGKNLLEIFIWYSFWILLFFFLSNSLWKKYTRSFEGYGV